ncbi:MAG: site-specific integrase [Prolixibacteraceae bacterium]
MTNVNVTTSFQMKKRKMKTNGEVPIYLRITVNSKRFEVSAKKSVLVDQWNSKQQVVKGRSEEARVTNRHLELLKSQINQHHTYLLSLGQPFSITDFKSMLNGEDVTKVTLIVLFKENNQIVKENIGNKYSESTYLQYITTLERLEYFLKIRYKMDDIELSKLDINFIRSFETFLINEYNIGRNTCMKYLKQLKKVLHYAMMKKYVMYDPFYGYQTSYAKAERDYLTDDELDRIESKVFKIKRLDEVRDVFIFSCYTGLAYSDLKLFSKDFIKKGVDGKDWLVFDRKKTGVRTSIPILEPARRILEKYKDDPKCIFEKKLLPVKSNDKLNSYMQEISELCEIDKHITMHIGRHTFATTVTLSNGVPLESVMHMLSHTNMKTTQIYARIVNSKLKVDMDKLSKKIRKKGKKVS